MTAERREERTKGVIFFFGMLVVFGLLNFYILRRGWQVLAGTGAGRWAFPAFYAFLFLSLFLARLVPSRTRPAEAFEVAGSLYIGLFAVLIVLVPLADILRLADRRLRFLPGSLRSDPRRAGHWAFAVVAGLALVLIAAGWLQARRVSLKTVEVAIDKPAAGLTSLEAAFVADIHLGALMSNARLEKLVAMINALRPDIVFIAGDVMNEEMSDEDLERMAAILRTIESRYGVYACPGNHEYYAKLERSLPALRRGGVVVLQDEARLVAGAFIVAGRGNTQYIHSLEKRKPLPEILAGFDLARPVILLDHQPARLADAEAAGVDLQLSGHTHAGQLIPFSWINGLLWDVGYGYGRVGRMQVLVTSGAGVWGPPMRIGTRSELVRLKIAFRSAKGEDHE